MKLHRQVLIAGFVLASSVVSGAAQAGIIGVFNGVDAGHLRSDWESAVGASNFLEEDFAGGVLEDFDITTAGNGHNGFSVDGGLSDRLGVGSSTTITFDFEIFAFGGNWDLSHGGLGLGIQVNAGGVVVPIEVPDTHSGEFFGFVADSGFTSIVLTTGTQGGGPEWYSADNFVYAAYAADPDFRQDPVGVSEPGSLSLLLLGVLALGLRRCTSLGGRAVAGSCCG